MREGQVFTKRGRLEIVFAILSLCRTNPSKKTHIMYRCNLGFNQLKLYLEFLASRGFLEVRSVADTDSYQATEKGREFLKAYQRIKELLNPSRVGSR